MRRLYLLILFIAISVFQCRLTGQTWECIGPEGGKIAAIKKDLNNPDTYYALTADYPTQIFRTTNAGSTWNEYSSANGFNKSFLIDEGNPNKFYLLYYNCVHRSTNSGLTWSTTFFNEINGSWPNAYSLQLASDNPNLLYAAGSIYIGNIPNCVFLKSTNSGQSFTHYIIPNKTGEFYSLAANRQNSNLIFASGYGYENGTYNNFLFRSTNGGSSFSEITVPSYSQYGFLKEIAFDPNDPGYLIAAFSGAIYRCNINTLTWQKASEPIYNLNKLEVDYTNKIIYACCYGQIWKSVNSTSWNLSTVQNNVWIHGVAFDAGQASKLMCASDFGVYKTTDSGTSWIACNSNLVAGNVSSIKLSQNQPASIYISLDNYCGSYKSANPLGKSFSLQAVTWTRLPSFYSCSTLEDFAISPANPNVVWALEGGG